MNVVCISGKARHGKDTVAAMLASELRKLGYRVLIAHYGDLVKYICRTFFGWNGEKDEYGRYIMQYVGTDLVRQKRPTFWTDFMMSVLSMFHDKWDYVLLPDCRFPNELTCVADQGFPMVHLRIRRWNFSSPLTETQKKHPSETALDDITPDIIVENDAGLPELREKAELLVEMLRSDFFPDKDAPHEAHEEEQRS